MESRSGDDDVTDNGMPVVDKELLMLDRIGPATVQGVVITGPREVGRERLVVDLPGAEYVKVAVRSCGLCTWEQRVYRGAKPTYPFWGGHELSGTVEDVETRQPTLLSRGDRVALALLRRCGHCELCKRGLDNHCVYVRPEPRGTLPPGPRGLSDYIYVPLYQVFRLHPNAPFEMGTLVEPLACVLRSVDRAAVGVSDVAVVLGAGTMGLIHTALLRLRGCRVIVLDDDETTHRNARAAGADLVLPSRHPAILDEIRRATDGRGADAIFCVRGGVQGIELALTLAARGGRLVLFQSIRDADRVRVSANDVHYREVSVIGTISQGLSDFQRAADLVSQQPELLSFLVTESMSAEQVRAAFERAVGPDAHRVMISFHR
jgi:L-iditol 2-dehydrogenase